MLTQAVNDYLAVRRAAGFTLKTTERYLRYFVRFAEVRGETSCAGEQRDRLGGRSQD